VIYRAFYIYRNIPVTYLPGLKCYLSNRFIPPVDPTTSGGASLWATFIEAAISTHVDNLLIGCGKARKGYKSADLAV